MGKQVGCAALSMLGAHDHSNPGQGGQLNPGTALNPQIVPDFGDGSDGDVTIVGNVNLTRDMAYNRLVVSAASILYPRGFKIRAAIKLTVDAGGYISAVGQPGVPGASGFGGPGGLVNYPVLVMPEACLPTAGSIGGDGGAPGVNEGGPGVAPPMELAAVAGLVEGRLWAGAGGAGGGCIGNNSDIDFTDAGTPLRVLFGARGGNGAQGVYTGPGNKELGGGGGGGGGGKIDIEAQEIDNNGTIRASGGIGGDGEGDAAATAGGGGGGGGGAIYIKYKTVSGGGLGTRQVLGGAGGASFGGVADGLAGEAGFSYAMKIAA